MDCIHVCFSDSHNQEKQQCDKDTCGGYDYHLADVLGTCQNLVFFLNCQIDLDCVLSLLCFITSHACDDDLRMQLYPIVGRLLDFENLACEVHPCALILEGRQLAHVVNVQIFVQLKCILLADTPLPAEVFWRRKPDKDG